MAIEKEIVLILVSCRLEFKKKKNQVLKMNAIFSEKVQIKLKTEVNTYLRNLTFNRVWLRHVFNNLNRVWLEIKEND